VSSVSLAGAVRRRWYVVVLGAIATLILAAQAAQAPGVYFTRLYVVFLPPLSTANPNTFSAADNSNVIAMAGLVGQAVSSRDSAQPVSDGVTILGEGISHGYLVRQPNDGGQWAVNFDRPELDVQVAGGSPAEVLATLSQVLQKIDNETRSRQEAAGTATKNMITTRLSPSTPDVYLVKGSRLRAGLAALLLGLGLSLAGAWATDRVLLRRQRRPEPGGDRPPPTETAAQPTPAAAGHA
jgi:hypothetical protein